MVGNTGTYIDSPFHRWADGPDLAALALEQVADLEGLVFRADPSRRAIGTRAVCKRRFCPVAG